MKTITTPLFPDLHPGKHLVLDHHAVADTFRLRRQIHQPQSDPPHPLFESDKSWEGTGQVPLNVVYNEERACFQLWYHILNFVHAAEQGRRTGGMNIGEPQRSVICYAESSDGAHWKRPDLHIYPEEDGCNNICFKGMSQAGAATIMRNPRPPHEYLMFNNDWFSRELRGVAIARSADGIQWKYEPDEPVIFGHSDTTNSVVYNPERDVFMLYMRAWHSAAYTWLPERNTRRRVTYSESQDLIHWTEPQIIITPDELDTDDLYGMAVFRYADYYLGQLQIYDAQAQTMEIELAWSHDGFHWSRLPERPKFIPRGAPGEPHEYMVITAQAPLMIGEEMFVYYAGYDQPHDADHLKIGKSVHLLRGKLRPDGFISLVARNELGALITRPFTLQNNVITINARAHGGELVAELVEPFHEARDGDSAGKPIAGFGAADFDAFRGESTRHVMTWRGNGDLSTLLGRRLMLRLSLKNAEIFSFSL